MHLDVSDGDLFAALRSPDPRVRERAFSHIFWRHQHDLHRYARRFVGIDLADEVVQETLLVVWRRAAARHREAPRELRPYMYAVARNIARATFRQQRAPALATLGDDVVDVRALTSLESRTRLKDMLDSASRLSATNRQVVGLILADVSVREAAAIRKVSEGAEKVQRRRARKALAAVVGNRDEDRAGQQTSDAALAPSGPPPQRRRRPD